MDIPINILFWGYLIAYLIHIVEEYSVGPGFVNMMRKHFWSDYTGRMFFGFNLMTITVFTCGILLYEVFDGIWVVWPLGLGFMFVTNGFWHLLQTIAFKEYSPGLITAPIYWILMFFILRYNFVNDDISVSYLIISFTIGCLMTLLMFGSAYYKRREMKKDR